MKPFTDGIFKQTLVPEPAVATQERLPRARPVVQAVLTDKNANIHVSSSNRRTTSRRTLIDGAR